MLRFIPLFVGVGVLLATGSYAEELQKDAPKLEGSWVATAYKRGEGEVPKDKIQTTLTISKDTYEYPTGINRIGKKGKLKVDAEKGTIDFTPEDGPAKGKTLVGIYKVEKDVLTICFTGADGKRPTEFKTADRNTVLATYERKK